MGFKRYRNTSVGLRVDVCCNAPPMSIICTDCTSPLCAIKCTTTAFCPYRKFFVCQRWARYLIDVMERPKDAIRSVGDLYHPRYQREQYSLGDDRTHCTIRFSDQVL